MKHATPFNISSWLAGHCTREEAVALKDHLAACPDCERQYRLVCWFRAFLGRESAIPDPTDLLSKEEEEMVNKAMLETTQFALDHWDD